MTLRDRDRLYLITDRTVTSRPLVDVIEAAVAAGVSLVQLREKDLPDAEYVELALPVRKITERYGARLLLNGRWRLVESVGADGVHLPRDSSVQTIRDAVGPKALIGFSAHTRAELHLAERSSADFVTLSPVFPTPSKPGAAAVGIEGFGEMCREADLPVYGLGGVGVEQACACVSAGAFGVAVVRGVLSADDVAASVQGYLRALGTVA